MSSDKEVTIIQVGEVIHVDTSDDMRAAGEAANMAASKNAWEVYHSEITKNTKLRQLNDLASYSAYLYQARIARSVDELYHNPRAWAGTSYGLLEGYKTWAMAQGYAIGTINVRLATLHKYCELAGPNGMQEIDAETLQGIQAVKGIAGKKAHNRDSERIEQGIPTRKGYKKAQATPLTTSQALALKKTTTPRPRGTQLRDAALMGLMIENALRCGEVAGLMIENVSLRTGEIIFYREKTHKTEIHALHKHTLRALEDYLAQEGRKSGPLFLGNNSKPLSKRAINARVHDLGEQIGVDGLSPHDLRHQWTRDALRNGTPFDRVKSGGGWTSDSMPMRYAAQVGVANEGVTISEE